MNQTFFHTITILSRHLTAALAVGLLLFASPIQAKSLRKSAIDKVPPRSERIDGYSEPDSIVNRLAATPLHTIEGIWRFASEGTLMAIERISQQPMRQYDPETVVYRMVVVRAADMALRPGTVMGFLTPTAKRGVYDARIYTSRLDNGTTLHSPKTFTLSLTDDDSRLTIKDYGSKLRFNWWRLLPYMYRYLFTRQDKSPGDVDGCLRVFPTPSIPSEPRYL